MREQDEYKRPLPLHFEIQTLYSTPHQPLEPGILHSSFLLGFLFVAYLFVLFTSLQHSFSRGMFGPLGLLACPPLPTRFEDRV